MSLTRSCPLDGHADDRHLVKWGNLILPGRPRPLSAFSSVWNGPRLDGQPSRGFHFARALIADMTVARPRCSADRSVHCARFSQPSAS